MAQLYNGHHYVNSDREAVAAAINAGVDVISDQRSDTRSPNNALVTLVVATVQEKLLSEDVLTCSCVSRNLMVRFRLGMFDPPEKVPFTPKHPFDPKVDCHASLALKMAQECFVLLKNDPAPKGYGLEKLLPLDLRKLDSLATPGPECQQLLLRCAYSGSPRGAAPKLAEAIKAAAGDPADDPNRTLRTTPTTASMPP